MKHAPITDRAEAAARATQTVRRGSAEAMRQARQRGDMAAWSRAFIESQWKQDEINREFWK